MRRRVAAAGAAIAAMVVAGAAAGGGGTAAGAAPASPLRLNHIQVMGSHNSYHVEQPAATIDLYHQVAPQLEPHLLAYSHEPLTEQLDMGFRQFELDVFSDPTGTLFAPEGTPGFKVLHIDLVDEGSTCPLFTDCLAEIEAWSAANPTHVPIAVLVELKEGEIEATGPIDAAALRALDAEIRSVFDDDQLITPDFVRGVGRPGGADGAGTVYPNVNAAVTDVGWPLLEDVRGRVLFLLDNERNDYVDGDPTLAGRVAFPPSSPGLPDAAFLKMNDPLGGGSAAIAARVAEGYMVRTRSDAPVTTGLTGDATQRTAALASGAHWVSGDYLTPTDHARYDQAFADRFGLPFDPDRPAYQTVLPEGGLWRCNPLTAPPGCDASDIEPGLAPAPLPRVVPGSGSTVEGEDGTAPVGVPVFLSAPSASPVTVEWRTLFVPGLEGDQAVPGDDYEAASGTVTFAPGQTAALVAFDVVGDTVAEPVEHVLVSFHDPVGARMGGFWGLGAATIVDDDLATSGVVVLPGYGSVLEADGATLEVPVFLSEPADVPVSVQWTTLPAPGLADPAEAGSDHVASSGTVDFAPGATFGVAAVPVLDDATAEATEIVVVSFHSPTGGARMGGFWGLGLGSILDAD